MENPWHLRVTARTPDRKKVVALQAISQEMLVMNGEVPIGLDAEISDFIASRIHHTLQQTAKSKVSIEDVSVFETMEVETVLTEEDLADDSQWADMGYKVGDTYFDWVAMERYKLDKNILAQPQDSVV
jgi:hypothetical protein